MIVIRSLVPGGVAERDGRLLPGDRLMYVNSTDLESASLEDAVQALKGAQLGRVQIGVAKPLPVRSRRPPFLSSNVTHIGLVTPRPGFARHVGATLRPVARARSRRPPWDRPRLPGALEPLPSRMEPAVGIGGQTSGLPGLARR